MDLVIPRSEATLIGNDWTLLYGRRKTGKTYLLRNFMDVDEYILVGREGSIWLEKENRKLGSFDELSDMIRDELGKGKRIVIDEFQRIPPDLLEWMSSSHPSGQLILSGSSMGVVRKVLGTGSPILGKFRELRLGLVGGDDLLGSGDVDLDHAPYLSDPWTIPFLKGINILQDLYSLLDGTSYTVPGLVGEIFHEEDRTLSEIYQGILSSIGSGKKRSSEIATELYNKGLITKDSPSAIGPYLSSLKMMGIIEEIRIHGKKRNVLRFTSEVMTLFYYMESKYGLEMGLPPVERVKANLKRIHSFCMEYYLVRSFSRRLGGDLRYSFDPELDGIIVDRKEKPMAVIEVKWSDLRKGDIKRFKEKTGSFDCEKFLLARNSKGLEDNEITIMDKDEIRKYIIED